MNTTAIIALLTPEQRARLPEAWFDVERFGKRPHIGPDITDPANLAALLAVCDAVAGDDSQIIEKCPQAIPSMVHRHTICHGRERDWFEATGPTRTAAALAALDKALGVGNE